MARKVKYIVGEPKVCPDCGVPKPWTEEHYRLQGGRLDTYCKPCRNKRGTKWYLRRNGATDADIAAWEAGIPRSRPVYDPLEREDVQAVLEYHAANPEHKPSAIAYKLKLTKERVRIILKRYAPGTDYGNGKG